MQRQSSFQALQSNRSASNLRQNQDQIVVAPAGRYALFHDALRFARRYLRDDRGSAALITALSMPVMIGFGALAIDVGSWYSQKRQLQTAADAAAMAAGITRYRNSSASQSALESAASTDVTANGFDNNLTALSDSSALLVIHRPPTSGNYTGQSTAIEAIITQRQQLMLAGYFVKDPVSVQVRAVVSSSTLGGACLLALEQVNADALSTSGNINMNLKKCGIASNSNSSTASMYENGSASVTSDYVHLAGALDQQNGSLNSPSIVQNGPRVGDPYRDVSTPTTSGGTQVDPTVKPNKSATLDPGTYPSMTLQGTANLNSGTYVINGGTLTIDSQATVNGNGVTFVLKNNATVKINGGATVNVSAPTSGSSAGIAFYQAPGADPSITQKFNGGSNMTIGGAIYFPNETVSFNGGNANNKACTHVVARVITVNGNSDTNIDCTAAPSSYNPDTPEIPYLVE